jgi:hypothetical protein
VNDQRTALDRFLAAIPYAVAALVLLSILFWQAAVRKSPTLFTDELEWSQISRAIAHTGHAARRGEPVSFKSLYAFLIAPTWWLPTTASAYTAVKYLNTIVMALTAVPVYLLARQLVSQRAAALAALGTLCTSALFYAALLIPEVLAYPVFALYAYVVVRALAGAGRRWTIAAVVLSVVVVEVRSQLIAAVAAAALAATWLWLVGPRGRRLRSGWSRADHVGAILLLGLILVVLNRLATPHAQEWAKVTQNFRGRIWSYAFVGGSALAIGLGVLPMITGLASLWLPERREDPKWRAFAAFLGATIVTFGLYTGVKAAYLSTFFTSRTPERNLIYLAPLLLVGTAVFFSTRRTWWPGVLAATAFVAWLVLGYGYQLGYPYFEAPGYGIAAFANRIFHWDQPHISNALAVAIVISVAIVALRRFPAVVAVAVLAVAVWMTTGEITSARGSEHQAKQFVANMAKPLNWIDLATHSAGTTYLGQGVADDTGVWLTEFWNLSLKHVDSLDASCCAPGPHLTPGVDNPDGTLRGDSGDPYVLADNGVQVIGDVVAKRGDLLLTKLPGHPWRLKDAVSGRDPGGWIQSDGGYAYFGPERTVGTLRVDVGRTGFCPPKAPKAHVTITVGSVGLDAQNNPIVGRVVHRDRFVVPNCASISHSYRVRPPVAVHVHVTPLVVPAQYGVNNDQRALGAQVTFSFSAKQ